MFLNCVWLKKIYLINDFLIKIKKNILIYFFKKIFLTSTHRINFLYIYRTGRKVGHSWLQSRKCFSGQNQVPITEREEAFQNFHGSCRVIENSLLVEQCFETPKLKRKSPLVNPDKKGNVLDRCNSLRHGPHGGFAS